MRYPPTVGVAIPVHNGERYLAAAISSVLAQTYHVCDIVVVDDGSEQSLEPLMEQFQGRARLVRQDHSGVAVARNRAIELVQGDLVVSMDADDLLTPVSVQCRVEAALADPSLDLVFGHVQAFRHCHDGVPVPVGKARPAPVAGAMLMTRRSYSLVGPFSAGVRVEGLEWLLRAREVGLKQVTAPELVQWRRVHGANSTVVDGQSRQEMVRVLKAALDRRRRDEQTPVPRLYI